MIRFDEEGKIVDFEVMVRPFNGLQALGEEMGARLAAYLPAYKAQHQLLYRIDTALDLFMQFRNPERHAKPEHVATVSLNRPRQSQRHEHGRCGKTSVQGHATGPTANA